MDDSTIRWQRGCVTVTPMRRRTATARATFRVEDRRRDEDEDSAFSPVQRPLTMTFAVGYLWRHDDGYMFFGLPSFNQDISGWNVDNVGEHE